jgi:hypothetical protein
MSYVSVGFELDENLIGSDLKKLINIAEEGKRIIIKILARVH